MLFKILQDFPILIKKNSWGCRKRFFHQYLRWPHSLARWRESGMGWKTGCPSNL